MKKTSEIILSPTYVNQFSCLGPTCEDLCCGQWNIDVDKNTYFKYRKVNDATLKPLFEQSIKRNRKGQSLNNYAQIILNEDRKCNLLNEENHCLVHKNLGEAFLCNTCAIYPREYRKMGGLVEKSLSLSCPEAARTLLLNPNGIEFAEQEPGEERILFTDNLDAHRAKLLWPVRIFVIRLLQNRQYSIELRLIFVGLFLQKLEAIEVALTESIIVSEIQSFEMRLKMPEYIEAIKSLSSNIPIQIQLGKELLYENLTKGAYNQRSIDVLNDFIQGLGIQDLQEYGVKRALPLYEQAYSNYYEPYMKEHEFILENYLVNYIFTKFFPNSQNSFSKSYTMLAVNFSLIKLQLIGMANTHQGLTEELVIKCIQSYSKAVDHNKISFSHVQKKLNDAGLNTVAHMFIMIKS